MKKLTLVLLALLLALPARAELLNFQVTDTLSINAEAPDAPGALPSIRTAPHAFDASQLQKMFMKTDSSREDVPELQLTTLGKGDGLSEYMLIDYEAGRFGYSSKYYNQYLELMLRFRDDMSDWSFLFPQDLELDGMPKAEAVSSAREMLEGLGIRLLPGERVYTLEKDSYAGIQALLAQSEAQVYMSKRYLEPFDPAHEGYYMVFEQQIGGLVCGEPGIGGHVDVLITRQGYEYVETGYVKDAVSESGAAPVLSAEQALKGAADQLRWDCYRTGDAYGKLEDREAPAVIERVRLAYESEAIGGPNHIPNSDEYVPVWMFTFQRASWQGGESRWRNRTMDNHPFLLVIHVDARTGKLLYEEQC